jgi:membrane-associated phospholipid phosphatase
VLHPLLMPSYLFLVLIVFVPEALHPLSMASMLRVLIIVFITTFIIPSLSIGTLRLSAFISDITLVERRERILPFGFITCFYGLTAYLFYDKIHLNNFVFVAFAATTALLLVLFFITLFWKVSLHSAGVSGVAGFLFATAARYPTDQLLYPFIASLLCLGLAMAARLRLQIHHPAQVYAGAAIGFALCAAALYYFV